MYILNTPSGLVAWLFLKDVNSAFVRSCVLSPSEKEAWDTLPSATVSSYVAGSMSY